MRRTTLLVALAALGLAACGGENGRETERPPASETPAPRTTQRGAEPSRARIEEFGKLKLPASSREVVARMNQGMDTGLFLSFVMDRDEVDRFVRDGHFDAKAGYKPSYPYEQEGWHLDRIQNTLGAEEFDGNYGRELVIDLDQPDLAKVYLVATTVKARARESRQTRGMHLRLRAAAVAVLVAAAGTETAAAALPASGGEPAGPPRSLIAEVPRGDTVAVHSAPGGRTVARVRPRTPFGSPTRLAVLDRRGGWLAVSTETLGNTRRGWIRISDVRVSATAYRVVITLSARRLELRYGTRLVRRTRVAVGSAAHPTPTGRFGITDKLPGRRFGSAYGCCILALSAVQTRLPAGWPGGDRIAVHGTNSPASLGRAVSTGCVRVDERPLRTLMRRVPLGTPVLIRR